MSVASSENKTGQESRRIGYGLPCAKCNTYYFADLNECPVCHARERIAQLTAATVKVAIPSSSAKVSSSEKKPLAIVEKRSMPSLTVIPRILEVSSELLDTVAQPADDRTPAAPVLVDCAGGLSESSSTTVVANEVADIDSSITVTAAGAVEKKAPVFAEPGSVGDCWSIIMGRDRGNLIRTNKPEPPKEIAATDFSKRCVQLLEEIYVSGDTVIITSMGRPVARIVPIGDESLKLTGS